MGRAKASQLQHGKRKQRKDGKQIRPGPALPGIPGMGEGGLTVPSAATSHNPTALAQEGSSRGLGPWRGEEL